MYKDEILEGVTNGRSVKEISTIYDISLPVVKASVIDLGLVDDLQNKSYFPWLEDEDTQLIEEWNTKPRSAMADIAEVHKRTIGAIKARVKHLQQIEMLPLDEKPVKKSTKKSNNWVKWSEQDVELLQELADKGVTWSDIGLKIGRTHQAVYQKYHQLLKAEKSGSVETIDITISCGDNTITVSVPANGDIDLSIPKLEWSTTVSSDK